jgi:hypothetical protein
MASVHDAIGGRLIIAPRREDHAEEVGLRFVTLAEAALRPDFRHVQPGDLPVVDHHRRLPISTSQSRPLPPR